MPLLSLLKAKLALAEPMIVYKDALPSWKLCYERLRSPIADSEIVSETTLQASKLYHDVVSIVRLIRCVVFGQTASQKNVHSSQTSG